MSEWEFTVWQPAGYGLDLSFHPGTSMGDVPASMIMIKARELLSDDALQKLRELQAEIDQVKKMLAGMPATTLEEQLRRTEPLAQLAVLNVRKGLYLETPKEQVAKGLALKACKPTANG